MSAKWRRTRKSLRKRKLIKEGEELLDIRRKTKIINFKNKKPNRFSPHGIPAWTLKTKRWREPKPLVDVFEQDDEVIVVAELAGFSKENLRANARKHKLILAAEAQNRKYNKSLNLPSKVIPNTLRVTFKNGVLVARLRKAAQKRTVNKIVGLENAA